MSTDAQTLDNDARERFRELRKEANMAPGTIAQKLGVPIHLIARFESGAGSMEPELLQEAFDIFEAESGQADDDGPVLPEPGIDADLFHILNAIRRRDVILFLNAAGRTVDLGRMSRLVAASENGKLPNELSSDERKRVYIALQQAHVDKLDDAGAAEVSERTNTLTPTPLTDVLAEHIRSLMAVESPGHIREVDRVIEAEGMGGGGAKRSPAPELHHVPTPEQFRAMRRAAGVTQIEVSEAVGCTNTTICNYELGETSLRSETLREAMQYIREALSNGGTTADG